MISKWYRGHNGKQKATDNFGIIWLADNPEYAQLYADEYGNDGVVSVFYIDESKLNCADTYYNDNFDVYDPDMREVKEYQKEGYNCYTFPVDMGDTDVLALFDESAIVKIEQMDKSKIKLTESELKIVVKNCVRKVLSESEQRYNVGKIGKWNRIPSNGYEFHKIPGKGTCVGIMMYVDSTSEMEIPPTYCLFRRGDNGKYFYATIVASPKDGPKATKFSIVPLKEIPEEIYKDIRKR